MANFIPASKTNASLEYLLETPWSDGDTIEFGGVVTGRYDASKFDSDYIRVRRPGDSEWRMLKLANYIRLQTRKSREPYQEFLDSKFYKELASNKGKVLEFLNSIKEGVFRVSTGTVASDFTGEQVHYSYFDFKLSRLEVFQFY